MQYLCAHNHTGKQSSTVPFFFFSSPVVVVITVASVCGAGFSMQTEGSVDIVWCAWRGLKGFQGDRGCFSLMKCSGCTEHYTHIKPSLAAFLLHSHCHALCTDLSMTLNKTVTFDLPSGNDQGDE